MPSVENLSGGLATAAGTVELVQLLLPREDTVGNQLSANNARSDDRDKTTCSKGQDLPPTPSSTIGR